MISILLLLALTHSLFGAPLNMRLPPQNEVVLQKRASSDSDFLLDNTRTLWDIIWSCLATIFACTWVAVHPNIPSPKADFRSRLKNKVVIMVYAWIAPECVTMWAMRQLVSARELARICNNTRGIPNDDRSYLQLFLASLNPFQPDDMSRKVQRWTLTHGFFAQMGGYTIFRDSNPYWTLCLEDVDLPRDINLIPYYTEEEIMDRSKGDVLSKGVALLQTAWFGMQYFTRVYNQLPLTELETVTLAFVVLNFVMYILWWYKPLNVQCPIRVYESSPSIPAHDGVRSENSVTSDAPAINFDDLSCHESDAWEDRPETPWFPPYEVALQIQGKLGDNFPPSDTSTLISTPSSPLGIHLDIHTPPLDETWSPNELPWFPTPEVLSSRRSTHTERSAEMAKPSSRPGSLSDLPPSSWHYRLPWSLNHFPRHVFLTIDGGWYIIHLIYDDMNEGDGPSTYAIPHDNQLEINFYVPLFIRNRSWAIQMCLVLPLWSLYIASVVLYTFGPYRLFAYLLAPLASMTGVSQATQESWMDSQYPLRVPPFFSGPNCTLSAPARSRIWYATFLLTSVFGTVHALGWFSHFPTQTEREIWRISTLIICGVPPTVALWVMYRRSSFPQLSGNNVASRPGAISAPIHAIHRSDIYQLLQFLASKPARVGMPMYIFARIALITLAIISLREQPQDAFKNPPWTSTIPHL
ncbi:hypothetical protein NP233_g481 [Leucocoprinus birnbaumii]|uniref:Uncharacterized protein n=1 Tax=Leucocoprinus birnbaumii TaxID=56174 RepID=A0AAD5Z089_9AGAR|nr:hypothetical protein NP233_g481 [Leucocoprinus birnbaumii]